MLASLAALHILGAAEKALLLWFVLQRAEAHILYPLACVFFRDFRVAEWITIGCIIAAAPLFVQLPGEVQPEWSSAFDAPWILSLIHI